MSTQRLILILAAAGVGLLSVLLAFNQLPGDCGSAIQPDAFPPCKDDILGRRVMVAGCALVAGAWASSRTVPARDGTSCRRLQRRSRRPSRVIHGPDPAAHVRHPCTASWRAQASSSRSRSSVVRWGCSVLHEPQTRPGGYYSAAPCWVAGLGGG